MYGTLDVNAGILLDEHRTPQLPPPNLVLCATCPDEPPAEFSCITCAALSLCLSCKHRHETRRPGHQIVPVEESKDTMCMKHPNKRVEFCCVDPCHELICSACGLLEHATHKFSSLTEAAELERTTLERAEAEATATSDASSAAANKALEDCRAFAAGQKELVKGESAKLIRLIDQKTVDALASIDVIMAPELQRLVQEKKAAVGVSARVRSHAAVSRRLRDPEKCSQTEVFRLSQVGVKFFGLLLCF